MEDKKSPAAQGQKPAKPAVQPRPGIPQKPAPTQKPGPAQPSKPNPTGQTDSRPCY